MLTMETWWTEIFSGNLAVGLNESKIHQLQDESFLYYSDPSSMIQPNNHLDVSVDFTTK